MYVVIRIKYDVAKLSADIMRILSSGRDFRTYNYVDININGNFVQFN